MQLVRTDSKNPDFIALVQLLDADLFGRYGDLQAIYTPFNKIDFLNHVVVIYREGIAAACGAFKPFSQESVEIKRMFVSESIRRQGLAYSVLNELEAWAKELNYGGCVLETGTLNLEAIRLYEKAGYAQIENYGPYVGMETSVCYRKAL